MTDRETAAEALMQQWRDKIATIARNLTDFNESEACKAVKARLIPSDTTYVGATAEAARAAAAALDALWRDYLMLSALVDEADDLMRRSNLLARHDDQVIALLTSPSIKPPTVAVPVQQRGLLDSPELQRKISPEQMLQSMIAAFDLARQVVTRIITAESGVSDRLAALEKGRAELANWAADAGLVIAAPDPDALAAAARDPLAIDGVLAAAESDLANLRARQATWRAEQGRLAQALASARADLRALDMRVRAARAACESATAEIEAAGLTFDPALERAAADLEAWLERLAQTAVNNQAHAGLLGLEKWRQACTVRRAEAEALSGRARALLLARDDLRGRLSALRAKGAALAATRPVPPTLATLEAAAKVEVRRAPFRADDAARAVMAYEAALGAFARAK